MRIAIDCSAIPRQMAGAGVYTYQLVRALAELESGHEFIAFARSGLLDEFAASHPRLTIVHVNAQSRPARLVWEQTVLPALLQRHRIDLLHSPHHHTPRATRVPRVVTFHDVTFLLLPQRYSRARRIYMTAVTRASAGVAKAIITPSNTVRQDVIRELNVPEERVTAIAEAAASSYAPIDDAAAIDRVRGSYQLPERYILSVGSLEPGKNRGRIILALAQLRQEIDCSLIVVGQPAWRYDAELELAEQLGLGDRVRFLGYVPDSDMPALYSNAAFLVFPSLYEGFGLPVLEAMACGTPVITSTGSAPAEIAGDAALLVEPRDIDALAGAMRQLLFDDALRNDLRTRGLERSSQFSWETAARRTLSVYETVASNR